MNAGYVLPPFLPPFQEDQHHDSGPPQLEFDSSHFLSELIIITSSSSTNITTTM